MLIPFDFTFSPQDYLDIVFQPSDIYIPRRINTKYIIDLFEWKDMNVDEPDYLINLEFENRLTKKFEDFYFCANDFTIDPLKYGFKNKQLNNELLISYLDFTSKTPTMVFFKKVIKIGCYSAQITNEFKLSSVNDLKTCKFGSNKFKAEIIDYFNEHNTNTFRVCYNFLSADNKSCHLIVNNDSNTLFSITNQQLEQLFYKLHSEELTF